MDVITAIEEHHRVTLPSGFRAWSLTGYTDYRNGDGHYLWVHEAEWIPPDQILSRDLGRDGYIPGLIPFAFTGAGDHWCWNTQIPTGESEYEILLCWHDEEKADVFAPSFATWFYRCCLEYAMGAVDDHFSGIREAIDHFRLWSQRLFEIGGDRWAEHLNHLATLKPVSYQDPNLRSPSFGFITIAEVNTIVARELGERYVSSKAEWGWYDN
jgi:hypothetical protein